MTSKSQLNFDPKAPPLTENEMKFARKELISAFPKVTRHKVDPEIPHQVIFNVSFMLLDKPHNGVVGFFKPRGVFSDEDKATTHAEDIIKTVDSCFIIHQAHMGHWSPITNNQEYSKDQMDVKTQKDELALRDRAMKEAARKNQELKRELEERKEEVKNRTHDDDNPESLDYYTKKKVAQKELSAYISQGKEKLKVLKKSLRKVDNELFQINKKHPDYCNQWLDNYNKERVRAGLPEIKETDLEQHNILGTMDVE